MEKNEGQQNHFLVGSVLLLSDLVIRREFIACILKIMTVSSDTFISKFSTSWNFTMRKCHGNKTFHSFF